MDSDQNRLAQDLYDNQLTTNLAGSAGMGLTEIIVRQLGGEPGTDRPVVAGVGLSDYRLRALPAQTGQMTPLPVSPAPAAAKPAGLPGEGVAQKAPDEPRPESPREFVRMMLPYARTAAERLGVDPRVLLAQAALESGWGQAMIKQGNGNNSHNLFGIKATQSWQGDRARVQTLEFEQGVPVKRLDKFRAYPGYAASFDDYATFLQQNPRYQDALSVAANPGEYVQALQQAGYATDPDYAAKILQVYHGDTMSQAMDAADKAIAMPAS